MAKSYAQRNRESVARTGRTLYERRIESARIRGLSRSQGRGHPARGELSAKFLQDLRAQGVYATIQAIAATPGSHLITDYAVTVYGPEEPETQLITYRRGALQAITDELDRLGIAYDVGTP